MLSKNKIDKKLWKYAKEHLSKGYSKPAVKKVLVEHGYDEFYVNRLLGKYSELQFVKKYAVIVSLLFIISVFSFNLIPANQQQKITGFAAVSSGDQGCCASICQQTLKNECYGKFVENQKCNKLEDCNVGCCIDREGYCLTNYLYGNCINGYGAFINKDCNDVIPCRNTTKSHSKGIFAVQPDAGYYNSSFNIRYYLYDKTNVLALTARIMEHEKLVDSITLYDDGWHNDGIVNDNLYGNNWLSSKIKEFDGFKKLNISIIIKYADGARQLTGKTKGIVVVSGSKCLPVYTEWSGPSERQSIILAAQNYENLSDGYPRFAADANNFVNALFSISKFSNNKGDFNVYRLEHSLSYFNTQTLLSVALTSCPSYSNKKDIVVVLDSSEDYCFEEKSRVVRANPNALFYKNITNAEINSTFDNFCSYVLTPKMIADSITNFATPPAIAVYTLDNMTYNTMDVNLSFSISAKNYPADIFVSLNDLKVWEKTLDKETAENIPLNLTVGANFVLLKAIDKNNNLAAKQLLLNFTMQ